MLLSGIHGASRALAGCPIKAFGHDDSWYTGNNRKINLWVIGSARSPWTKTRKKQNRIIATLEA
jgi:hypothetical protein